MKTEKFWNLEAAGHYHMGQKICPLITLKVPPIGSVLIFSKNHKMPPIGLPPIGSVDCTRARSMKLSGHMSFDLYSMKMTTDFRSDESFPIAH